MTATDEQLAQIELLAYRLMKPEEIALIIGVDVELFVKEIKNKNTAIHNRYYAGYLKAKSEINLSIVTHATAGSSPAQSLAVKFMTDLEMLLDE